MVSLAWHDALPHSSSTRITGPTRTNQPFHHGKLWDFFNETVHPTSTRSVHVKPRFTSTSTTNISTVKTLPVAKRRPPRLDPRDEHHTTSKHNTGKHLAHLVEHITYAASTWDSVVATNPFTPSTRVSCRTSSEMGRNGMFFSKQPFFQPTLSRSAYRLRHVHDDHATIRPGRVDGHQPNQTWGRNGVYDTTVSIQPKKMGRIGVFLTMKNLPGFPMPYNTGALAKET